MSDEYFTCHLKDQLAALKKSSLYAVDNTDSFEDTKAYLHVTREIEDDLKTILKEVNHHDLKTLILVTGSAGDGKSHLISYLKHRDPDHLLNGYTVINDATESDYPTRTAIETLAHRLEDFSDINLDSGDDKKVILAVNLGMLNNFIDSEYADRFKKLREFIDSHDLFTSSEGVKTYIPGSSFQNISFSDYQFFSLTEDSYDDSYLLEVFRKITKESEDNPFYEAYKKCNTCPLKKRCPLRANYLFFSSDQVQKVIAYKVIETVIKNKVIVTMRSLLDFIFEILVSPEFSTKKLSDPNTDQKERIRNYISQTLPILLNDGDKSNAILRAVSENDLMNKHLKHLDSEIIQLFSVRSQDNS